MRGIKKYRLWLSLACVVCLSGTTLLVGNHFLFSKSSPELELEVKVKNRKEEPKSPTPPNSKPKKEVKPKQGEVKKAEKYYGFLILGSDNGLHPGSDYTDSITYISYNPEKNKAYAIPIYRDAFITLTCGGEKNINHVYQDNGPDCLMQSVSKLLNLPIDYYVYTSADAFVHVANTIGGVPITPKETFCSHSSLISGKEYCVTAGQTYTMDGNMLLSYARDRDHGNGVPRANRHQDVVASYAKTCLAKIDKCASGVTLEMKNKKIVHNLKFETLIDLKKSALKPTTTFEFVPLGAIAGSNYEDGAGSWHMKLDPGSIAEKRATIIADFGERKV